MARRGSWSRDSKDYEDWIDAAYQDRLAAELLFTDPRLYDSCAFHCQQCAEKALKAYLIFKTHRLVDGHNLTWLCKQAVKHDQKFVEWLDESANLNHYYNETRYPGDFPLEFNQKQMESVLKMAQDMNDFIYQEIKQSTQKQNKGETASVM